MNLQNAKNEYALALAAGKKELAELTAGGKPTHPAVLDEILGQKPQNAMVDLGVLEIPADRIVGTKSAGRITAFTPSFLPLLHTESEFAIKWCALCRDHLDDTGIRDPILCYEYLGNFYVQEGNKRVSVLRHFGAPRIPGHVLRILPEPSQEPRIKAYYEFLEFFKLSGLYSLQFRRPGCYAKLLAHLDREPEQVWTERERRSFTAAYFNFLEALSSLNTHLEDTLPEEALLLWLEVYPFRDLTRLSAAELKKTLADLKPDMVASAKHSQVKTEAEPVTDSKPGILTRIIKDVPARVAVAFIHQLTPERSGWVLSHEAGRKHLEEIFADQITVRSYFDANTDEQMDAALAQALADGAQVVFTTSPKMSRATLRTAVKHPKVRFFNCSVDLPYSSLRTYYGRIYEAKFITGAIAGAMAQNDRIGYIASSPIMGVPASINAFALGARLTNPRARIDLRWSCCEGAPLAEFLAQGIRVVSNKSVPVQDRMYMGFCNYGTYRLDDQGGLTPLASPVWLWGKYYENVIRRILAGTVKEEKDRSQSVNYWLGMSSGVIGVELSTQLPDGVRTLAAYLEKGLVTKTLDPFAQRIVAQDGTVIHDGSGSLAPMELLHMDWLCDNVDGAIPTFDQILPISHSIVRELGVYRDTLPPQNGGSQTP